MTPLRLNRSHEATVAIINQNDFTVAADIIRKRESLSPELVELVALKVTGEFKGK